MSSEIRATSTHNTVSSRRNRIIAGAALIGIGLLVMVAQMVEMAWLGLLFLPALGLIFLLWGIATRNAGLMIPGGILSGIGLGAALIEGPLQGMASEQSGGVFLLSFGAGWALITVLSALFADETHRWPLIPGGILALIGGALLAGGPALTVVQSVGGSLGRVCPVALIAFGLYLLLRRSTQK